MFVREDSKGGSKGLMHCKQPENTCESFCEEK